MSEFDSVTKLAVKLLVEPPGDFSPKSIVPVFHRWIREGALAPELAIDVVNYLHVSDGPGVLLICHRASCSLDFSSGRCGLMVSNARADEPFGLRVTSALRVATGALRRLRDDEEVGSALQAPTKGAELWVSDRLRAPNDRAHFEALRSESGVLLAEMLGSVTASWASADARAPLGVRFEGR
ncbi:MAG: hypothetical protein HY791_23655 [Deltaproteobacteria bacterium]|nr:hypothetical protein [Deltaproteobacteria bacterium]